MRTPILLVLAISLAAAGCVSTPEDVEAAAAAPADDTAAATSLVTIQEEGATADAIAGCFPVIECGSGSLPARESESFFEQSLDGVLDAAELTLTWDAASPQTEELTLGIWIEKADGEYDWIYEAGASPLTLSIDALGVPAETVRGVYVNAYECTPVACASMHQPFTLEGALTLLQPTDA